MKPAPLALFALLLTACTLPGYAGPPAPRSTQYTYPGRAVHPETGVVRPLDVTVGEATEDGVFGFGLVLATGSTVPSQGQWSSFAECERERAAYEVILAQRGDRIMTLRCYRAHETGIGATQTR